MSARIRALCLFLAALAPLPAARGAGRVPSDAVQSSRVTPAQAAGPAAAEPEPPAAPALAPPAPAQLAPRAAPAPAAVDPNLPAMAPLPGLEARAEGGWRLRFPSGGSATLPDHAPASLGELGRRLARQPAGRVTVIAQASGPANDVSVARRLSLQRGIAVKQALAAGGLADTRIDIRPMGRTEELVDAVDVLPPAPPRDTGTPQR